jgi:hypothetical protein
MSSWAGRVLPVVLDELVGEALPGVRVLGSLASTDDIVFPPLDAAGSRTGDSSRIEHIGIITRI